MPEDEAKIQKRKMRKNNMRIFPTYKKLAWDYLFFYTIDFLFLTQVKGISAANVVLKNTFYALFSIILQIPASFIVELMGKRKSLILANTFNSLYIIIMMISKNLGDLIIAEFLCAAAFSIKAVAEPSLLSESIPPSRYKNDIYSKIQAKGAAGYHKLNAISKIISGSLFVVNPYIPMCLALVITIIDVILSAMLIEPAKKNKKINKSEYTNQFKDIIDGFAFIIKSKRLRGLMLCSAIAKGLTTILGDYYVALFESLNMSAAIIGAIAAVACIVQSYSCKKHTFFQNKFKNKLLITIALTLSITTIISGILGIKGYIIAAVFAVIFFATYNFGKSLFSTVMEQYMINFTNEKIDTKIFAARNLFQSISRVIAGLIASFLLSRFDIAYCMIIIGTIFTVIFILVGKYMKTRVGLKPEEYSKDELKYDSLVER